MGLFKRWRKEKEYTLAEAMEMLKKKEYFNHIPVPTRSGSLSTTYWLREEVREEKTRQPIGVTNPILETKQEASVFKQKRDRFMSEVNGDGEYKNIPYDISRSHSTKPGRVVPSYNNNQLAKNYQKKYGQSR